MWEKVQLTGEEGGLRRQYEITLSLPLQTALT